MTATRRVRGIAAVLATLTAATLATTAQDRAQAATEPEGAAHQQARTTLHLHVTGCDSCSVQLYQAIDGRPFVWHSAEQKIGSDHRVTFRVPTRRTHGMSFTLDAPWAQGLDAIPNVVTRYAGHDIDSSVTRKGARHAARAEGCWAGSSLDDLTLDFHVARIGARSAPGDPITAPLVYATHTMSSWGPVVKTSKGMIANQEAFYCTRPKESKVTFEAPGCRGCEVQVMNGALRPENVWGSRSKPVRHGAVTFGVPRPQTRGLSVTVQAPWEGSPGYTTVVAFRYPGHRVGDGVTFRDARSQDRGSACWGGSSSTALTIRLTVRKVTVHGTFGLTAGTIAYADVTQPWLKPILPGRRGVLGAQDLVVCRK
ncbi:MAG TPA: hypothetical protein VH228_05070 [Nocardioides sp.]|jgi:hypothetical protein|nr:hypothetical protein [Nocardioides sp.]